VLRLVCCYLSRMNSKIATLSLTVLLSLAAGCGPTGTALDDTLYPRKMCRQEMSVENNSSEPMIAVASLNESTHDAACEAPYAAAAEKTIGPLSAGTVVAELKCRQCAVHRFYSVYRPSNKSTPLYDESDGAPRALCTDTGCKEN
jgi:hypothetical protein